MPQRVMQPLDLVTDLANLPFAFVARPPLADVAA
jgi:hypothetical protein